MGEKMIRFERTVLLFAIVFGAAFAGFIASYVLLNVSYGLFGVGGGKPALPMHLQWIDNVVFFRTLLLPVSALFVAVRMDNRKLGGKRANRTAPR